MLSIDLHTHSFFSTCGIHTHLEILERGKQLGMEALAITDHGPALHSRSTSPFYDRLNRPVEGIRLLKGMECNLLSEAGDIDLPMERLPFLDVVLLGIHPNTPKGLGKGRYTEMLVKAIERNPTVDILTHLNDETYVVDFESVVRAATARGVAIELNNSKTLLRRVSDDITRSLVETVDTLNGRLVVTSDMHAIEELGLDDSVRPFLEQRAFPEDRTISASSKQIWHFLEERRQLKR